MVALNIEVTAPPVSPEMVFRKWPMYSGMGEDLHFRVTVPDMYGHMCHWHWDGGEHLCFTWMRPENMKTLGRMMNGLCPALMEWREEGSMLWIIDMAASPGMKGRHVGRLLGDILIREDLVKDGETVIFRRNGGIRPGRFGKAVCRPLRYDEDGGAI